MNEVCINGGLIYSFIDQRHIEDILTCDRNLELTLHPMVKQTLMIAEAIKDASRRNDITFDPFLGFGTTLLAAEKTDRRCYGIDVVAITANRSKIDRASVQSAKIEGGWVVPLPSKLAIGIRNRTSGVSWRPPR